MLLTFVVLTLLCSAGLTSLTIRSARRLNLSADESVGVQKVHTHWVPRLGGVPIFVATASILLLLALVTGTGMDSTVAIVLCLLPAFGIGLLEDITRRAGVLLRLVFTMLSAALGWWLLDGRLTRLDLPYIDEILVSYAAVAFALTLVAAAGVAHAINIIDGYNGLSGFFVAVVLLSIGSVAWQVDDVFITRVAFTAAAATLGFLVWNFPSGRIFMGDAGAYLLGFLIGLLSILLVARQPQVSAWFPLLLVMHPVWETLFSMYRRSSRNGLSKMGRPDALHLHSLVYRRVVKANGVPAESEYRVRQNATTSVYLWGAAILCAAPALIFWRDTSILMAFCAAYAIVYVLIYQRLVRFRMPGVMMAAWTRRSRKGYG